MFDLSCPPGQLPCAAGCLSSVIRSDECPLSHLPRCARPFFVSPASSTESFSFTHSLSAGDNPSMLVNQTCEASAECDTNINLANCNFRDGSVGGYGHDVYKLVSRWNFPPLPPHPPAAPSFPPGLAPRPPQPQFECAPGCTADLLANDRCDPPCFNAKCSNDNGKCNPYGPAPPPPQKFYCAPGCTAALLANSFCDSVCFQPECACTLPLAARTAFPPDPPRAAAHRLTVA